MRPLLPPLLATLALAAPAAAQSWWLDTLAPLDSAADDLIGSAIDVHGDRVVVGGYGHDADGLLGSGGAWIFERAPGGGFGEVVRLTAGDGATGTRYGWAVAIEGDTAFVGAYRDETVANDNGAVYVHVRQPDGSWIETQKLLPSDPIAGGEFGHALDADGDRLVVGAPGGMSSFFERGVAYVFERQPDGTWAEAAKVEVSDALGNDDFGFDVGLSGDRVIAGAYRQDDNGGSSGAAYVFERAGDGSWPLAAKLLASDGAPSDYFGYSVAISGDVAVAGAWLDDDAGSGTGSAYVFRRQPDGTWPETAKLLHPDPAAGDHFGRSIAIDGDAVLVGAIHDTIDFQLDAGSAHLYLVAADGSATHAGSYRSTHLPLNPFQDENFGHAVALDGGTLAIGASEHDASASNAGLAQVFFSFAGGGAPAPVTVGAGTAGCDGPLVLGLGLPPRIDSAGFGFETVGAPAASVGFLFLGTVAHPGLDLGLGILIHVDPLLSSPLLTFPMASDADGLGTTPLPLPDSPSLVGATLTAQAVFAWTTCPLPPFGLASSNGLTFTVVD